MKYFLSLLLIIPLSIFAQNVTDYKVIPELENELINLYVNHTCKHVNITDTLLKRLNKASKKYTFEDSTKHLDSSFYTATFSNKNGEFKFFITTYNYFNPKDDVRTSNRWVTLSITHNDTILLAPIECYTEEYVESYAEQVHSFLIDDEKNGFPDVLQVKYAYREYVDNDKFDCKDCWIYRHSIKGYDRLEIIECDEFLKQYEVPFILK